MPLRLKIGKIIGIKVGNAIGLKQLRALPIKERDRVAILLPPRLKSFSAPEIAACAGTIARLRLQLSLHRNAIVGGAHSRSIYGSVYCRFAPEKLPALS